MSTFSPFPTCCCLLRLIYSPSSCSRRSIQTAPTTGPSREDEWCVFLFCKWVVEFELAMNLALGNAHRCIWWTNTRQTLDKYFQHLPHLLNSRVQGLKRLAGSSTGLAAGTAASPARAPRSARSSGQRGHLQVRPDGQVRRNMPSFRQKELFQDAI